MSVFFYELADGLVAVVFEGGVVSQELICDVLGDLLVDTRLALLVRDGVLVPLGFLLLPLELLDPFCCLLAGDGLCS